MIRQISFSVLLISGLSMAPICCADAATVTNLVNHAIFVPGSALSVEQIRKNIILAGLKRHWHMEEDGPGRLKAVQANEKQSATVSISYTATSYSITLLSSTGLDQRGDDIDRRYNSWVRYLTQDIDDQLSRASVMGK